ncbi:MAG: TonB-dependent receptor [Novosphingobium sp.]|nr:TonB-dependent receptor [Novosphingobium sp.]MCP5400850.1 TonB-dependent receptor [Novosphingobium sp.]
MALSLMIAGGAHAQDAADDSYEDADIIVTGTLIRGQAPVGSNQIEIGEARIEETASVSSNDLLASIPQVTNYFNAVPSADLAIAANQIQIARPNLREISPNNAASAATLVLLDGHRIATAGVNQASVDPDLIPLAAIARVDVVTEGGSATYGADAVAGTINFVTKRRFDGVELDAQYGFADDYYELSVNGIVGKDWGTGSAYIAYGYAKNDALFGRDRDFIRRLDYSAQPYVPLSRECADPNLSINYVLGGTTITSIAAGSPDFIPGSFNACDETDNASIVPKVERHGALASLYQELDDKTSVNVKAFYSERTSVSIDEFTGQAQLPASFQVPAGLPPSIPVPIPGTPLVFDALPVANGAFSFSPALGVTGANSTIGIREWGANIEVAREIAADWEARALLNWSRSDSKYELLRPNTSRLNAASLAGLIDPFDIASSDPAAIADVLDNVIAGQAKDDLLDLRLIVEGPLFALPGGDVRLAVGYEYMHDDYRLRADSDIRVGALSNKPYDTYARNVHSVFGELLIPVVDMVEINLAARYDDYSDFGDTFNPKVAVNFRPVDWLKIRGNWGTSFTAPTPLDLLRANANTISAFPFVAFTRPGDMPPAGAFTVALQGSNPGLVPQEADTWSVGFEASPPFIPGLNVKLSYYNVEFKDILSTPTPNVGIFTDFPNAIQTNVGGIPADQLLAFAAQGPGGTELAQTLISQGVLVYELVDFRTGNFGILKVDGLDFDIRYRMDTGFGGVDLGINGIYQLGRESQVSPTSAVVDDLEFDTPELYLRGTIGADVGNLRAQASVNHRGGFDIQSTMSDPVQDHVGSFTTVDLFFKYDVPGDSALLRDLSFSLNVKNVFDQDPPVLRRTDQNDNGYANGFTFGRMFVLGVKKKF